MGLAPHCGTACCAPMIGFRFKYSGSPHFSVGAVGAGFFEEKANKLTCGCRRAPRGRYPLYFTTLFFFYTIFQPFLASLFLMFYSHAG